MLYHWDIVKGVWLVGVGKRLLHNFCPKQWEYIFLGLGFTLKFKLYKKRYNNLKKQNRVGGISKESNCRVKKPSYTEGEKVFLYVKTQR